MNSLKMHSSDIQERQTTVHPIEKNKAEFDGGLTLVAHKHLSTGSAISPLPPVKEYVIPLQQHIGAMSQVLVHPGDRVLKGQMIARPSAPVSAAVHSPVSGTVKDIVEHEVPHVSGLSDQCVIIENDFKDEWVERKPLADDYYNSTTSQVRKVVSDAGIVGLGGATFPSAVKQTEIHIKTLILNGVECEPYISCDDMLMREHAREIVGGAQILLHALELDCAYIVVESDKPERKAFDPVDVLRTPYRIDIMQPIYFMLNEFVFAAQTFHAKFDNLVKKMLATAMDWTKQSLNCNTIFGSLESAAIQF